MKDERKTNMSVSVDKWLSRISGIYGLWPLVPAGVVGAIAAFLSKGVIWVQQFGAFGYLFSGLFAFVTTSCAFALLAFAREKWELAAAVQKWKLQVNTVNPLQVSFDSLRLNISDIAHPVTNRIIKKTFSNCELMGFSNIVFVGCTLSNGSFNGCQFVIVRDDSSVNNVVIFEECHLVNFEFFSTTVFMNQAMFETVRVALPTERPITYEKPTP
jgi:hypothetical protein